MKLLFIIPEYLPHYGGGIATFYHNLLPNLAKAQHQITVLAGSAFTSILPDYQQDGIQVRFLDTALVNNYLSRFDRYRVTPELQRHLAAAWAAWEQVKEGDGYDLVEVTDWGMLFAPWITSTNSPPTVVQLHASIGQIDFYDPQIDSHLQGSFVRLLEAGLLASADELQANSQSNAKDWQLLTNRNVHYIPPSLTFKNINIAPENPDFGNGLVVGRIQYWKGVTVLCEALRLLGEQAPNIDWIGRDTVYCDAKSLMSKHLEQNYRDIWRNKILPLGTFSSELTCQYQAKAKFILVPSIWDVFNYTCVEGMAQGKVVLCSEGAGAVDLIHNGVNGLTFKANNSQSLATCLETVMSWSASRLSEVGLIAKETVIKELDPRLIAQKRIRAYEDLITRGKYLTRPNQWLIDAVSPQQKLDKPLAFLDRLPLRDLVGYTINRSLRKVLKTM
ncbi:MAG: glycosyltransferase family 4 protein [Pseudanabaena sp. M046S1SP1A06QC]|nr:glycosyltransferase family 4 protein [Pseudanabaena sp. M046S1SP1A06QC]